MTTFTEAEAKRNWCPLARVPSVNGVTCNRMVEDEFDKFGNCKTYPAAGARCIASLCMAWREGGSELEYHVSEDPRGPFPKQPEGEGWFSQQYHDHGAGHVVRRWVRVKTMRGYCGAFGKPGDA